MINKYIKIIAFILFLILGKLSGFLKDISLSYYFGTSATVDAYFVTTYIIGLFYVGIQSAIPLLILPNAVEKNVTFREQELAKSTAAILIVSLSLTTLLILVADVLSGFFLDGGSPETVNTAAYYIRLSSLTLPFLSVALLATTLRLAWGEKLPAISLVLAANLVFVSAIHLWHTKETFYFVLYAGIFTWILMSIIYGNVLLFLVKYLRFMIRSISMSRFKKLFGLSKVFYVEQLIPVVGVYFASQTGEGGVSLFAYSSKIYMLYITLAIVFINSYLVPLIAEKYTAKHDFGEQLDSIILTACLIVFPLAVFLVLNSEFIISLVFERGELSKDQISIMSNVFLILIISMPCVIVRDIVAKVILIYHVKISLFFIYLIGVILYILICSIGSEKISLTIVSIGYCMTMLSIALILMCHRHLRYKILTSLKVFVSCYVGLIAFSLITNKGGDAIFFVGFDRLLMSTVTLVLVWAILAFGFWHLVKEKDY